MDKLSVMNAFCRIVERGSFAQAAQDLGVSAPLLSRQIKQLEQSLACSLLTRTTRSMSLTESGRHYFEEAQAILKAVDLVEDRLREQSGEVQGLLRVNAPNSYGQMVLAPLLPAFLRRHPGLKLSLSLDDRLVDMVEGGYELSIRVRPPLPDSTLFARRIADVKQRLFAAPAYLAERGTPTSPDDLAGHATLGYLLAEEPGHWTLQGALGTRDVVFEPRLQVGSSLVLRDMLVAGLGIGALPDFISDAPEARGELLPVLPALALPQRHVFAITASRLGMDAKVRAFVDHVRAALCSSELETLNSA